jgi:hypothetical protein
MLVPDLVAARNAGRRWNGVCPVATTAGGHPTGGGRTQVTQFVVMRLARAGFTDALNTHPMP